MPRLPDASDLGRPVPQNRGGIVQGPGPDPTLGALSELGETLNREFERMDVLRAEDAANNLRKRQFDLQMGEQGYEKRRGSAALEKGTLDGYREQFRVAREELDRGLSTPRQKQMFKRFADAADLQFTSDLGRHVARESESYAKQLTQSVLANETDIATRNWNNPDQIAVSRERILGRIAAQQELDGAPPDQVALIRQQALSKLHLNVIQAAVDQQKLDYAEKYLGTMKDEIEASDMLRISGILGTRRQEIEAQSFAREVANPPELTDLGRAFGAIISAESGGQQFDKEGKPLTSPKGAIGIAQVMPTTGPEAAKLAGVKWDPEKFKNDPEYNKALGAAYFQQQVKEFGNLPMAAAAYNAGPGATKEAIKKAEKEGGQWLAYLPQETQKYVAKVTQDFNRGGQQQVSWSQIDSSLVERFKDNPEQLKTARAEAKIAFDQRNAAIKQDQEQAFTVAMQSIEQGASYEQIPMALRMKMDPDKLSTLREYDAKVRRGQPVETDWPRFYALINESTANPGKFAQRNLTMEFPHLADAQRNSLIERQAKAKEGSNMAAYRTPDQIREETAKSIAPKAFGEKASKEEKEKANNIRRVFDERLLYQAQTTGKAPDFVMAQQVAKDVVRDFVIQERSFLGFDFLRPDLPLPPAGKLTVNDVPESFRKKAAASMQARGITPTDQALVDLYAKRISQGAR